LRKELQKLKDVKCFFPTETFTNDNGAMIAKLADLKITNHKIGK
jgi:tRNA A37 threonylcarbamoyltransferase TsaD